MPASTVDNGRIRPTNARKEPVMNRYVTVSMLALATLVATAISGPALAGNPVLGKNVSKSPREVIVNHPGNVQNHSFIRNDGNFGLTIHNFNKGTVEQFKIDRITGERTKL